MALLEPGSVTLTTQVTPSGDRQVRMVVPL
jgi:hypothetical protein